MNQRIEIPRGERGMIRVFAVNRAELEMQVALSRQPKPDLARDLLGDQHLNTIGTEIFPVNDLDGVGLAGYLADGYAVPADQLEQDRAKLEALEGYVLLLFSNSFAGRGAELEVGPDLTLIGAYGEYQPDNRAEPLSSSSAELYSGAGGRTDATPGTRGNFLPISVAVMVVMAVIWWVLS